MVFVQLLTVPKENSWWKKLLHPALDGAQRFEIHCWNEEIQAISQALAFGEKIGYDWPYGTVISGRISQEFARYLETLPQQGEEPVPIFTLFLDNGFSSAHYGTELALPDQLFHNPLVQKVLKDLDASIGREEDFPQMEL